MITIRHDTFHNRCVLVQSDFQYKTSMSSRSRWVSQDSLFVGFAVMYQFVTAFVVDKNTNTYTNVKRRPIANKSSSVCFGPHHMLRLSFVLGRVPKVAFEILMTVVIAKYRLNPYIAKSFMALKPILSMVSLELDIVPLLDAVYRQPVAKLMIITNITCTNTVTGSRTYCICGRIFALEHLTDKGDVEQTVHVHICDADGKCRNKYGLYVNVDLEPLRHTRAA